MTIYLFLVALLMGLGAWCALFWGIRSGQFADVETIARKVVNLEPGIEEEKVPRA